MQEAQVSSRVWMPARHDYHLKWWQILVNNLYVGCNTEEADESVQGHVLRNALHTQQVAELAPALHRIGRP